MNYLCLLDLWYADGRLVGSEDIYDLHFFNIQNL